LLGGFVLGLIGGLTYAWTIDPLEFVGTSPAALRADFQADYLSLIASAYTSTGDLERARARLALFPGADTSETLGALAQARLAAGGAAEEAQSLARLAADVAGPATQPPASPGPRQSAAPTSSPTITRTPTTRPSPTVTLTPGAPFRVESREPVCDPARPSPRLQVLVLDSAGQGVPAVEVLVVWDDGQDRFYTGLKPELGIGYGDFTMTEGVTYTVRLAESDALVTGLSSQPCTDESSSTYPGSWRLTFVQPETS
jgi:hypothetical protein